MNHPGIGENQDSYEKIKSEENMLDNFIKVADMPQEIIEKYKNQVPAEFVQIWQEDGLR